MERFLDLVKQRYSVRSFLDKHVPDDQLNYILECGRLAPSAANFQPWHVIVVRHPEIKEKIASTYPRDWFRHAPVILVFFGDHQKGWKRADGKDHTDIDLAIMIDHITLAAAEIGLGTCWVCNFDAAMCRQIFDIPPHIEPIAYLPVGYPAAVQDDTTRHLKRKSRGEIIHDENL